MLVSDPPLAQQVAGIRAGVHAQADHYAVRSGVVAALHVLILACLARLLARFEDILALWQAGQLPHRPAAHPISTGPIAPRSGTPRTPTRPRSPRAPRLRRARVTAAPSEAPRANQAARHPPSTSPHQAGLPAHRRAHQSRPPPKPPRPLTTRRVQYLVAPFLLRYQIVPSIASPAKNRRGFSSSITAISPWFTPRSCSIGRKSVNM